MKRLVTLFILAVCFFPIAGAQNTNTMPNTEELQKINDSILITYKEQNALRAVIPTVQI